MFCRIPPRPCYDRGMGARAIGSGTISFGLVSIPVKVYSTQETSNQLSFNMLHGECGTRLKQQYVCPTCDEKVERKESARGYEFAKGQYVKFSDEEYKALLEVASNTIELTEFVPAKAIDPVFYDKPYYLGSEKGGERAYRLLAEAMNKTGLVGIAKHAARGKQNIVQIRPVGNRLVMQQLRFEDEVKKPEEVPLADTEAPKPGELSLAVQIIEQIAATSYDGAKYENDVKVRMLELIEEKIAGEDITSAPGVEPKAQVIDLMEALKASLGAANSEEPTTNRKPTKASKKKPAATGAKKKKKA